MKRLFIVLLLPVLLFSQYRGSEGLTASQVRAIIADSSLWKASGSTRITTQDGKAVYLDSLIVKYTVITYDSIKNTLRVGGLGGASVPLTVVGNKTSGNMFYVYNDKTGTIDSVMVVNGKGYIGSGTTTPYHYFSAVGQTASINITNPNYNKIRTDSTTASDTASVKLGEVGGHPSLSIKGNTGNQDIFFQNNKAGFGTASLVYDLHIKKASATGAEITAGIENTTANGYSSVWLINNTGGTNNSFQMGIGGTSAASPYTNTGYFFTGSNVTAMMFQAMKSNGYIRFGAGSATTEQMRLTSAGKLGLGTTTPLNSFSLVDATSGQGTGLHVVSSQWNKARSTWAAAHDTSSIMQYIDSAGQPRLSMISVAGDTCGLTFGGTTAFTMTSKIPLRLTAGSAIYNFSTALTSGFYPGANDTYHLGRDATRWNTIWGSDNIYLGGKGQTATMTISGENTIAGTDSALVLSALNGVPTISAMHTGTFTNGGRRFYTGADTLLLVNGAKTGRDSTVYVLPDGSINASGSITSGAGVYSGANSIFNIPSGSGGISAEDNLYINCDSNNNDADNRVIVFSKNSTISGTELARITEAGDSGWGTNSPGAKMEVNGNKSADTLLIVRNDRIGAPYDSVFSVLSNGNMGSNGVVTIKRSVSLTDAGEYTPQIPAGMCGWGTVMAGEDVEWARFRFKADGTVALEANSTNVGTTNDVDSKMNIYDAGSSGVVIENQLGSTLKFAVVIECFTP